jgi:hypothetical protein
VIIPPPVSAYACWDARDADPIARELAAKLLAAEWLSRFRAAERREPVLRLIPLNNRSNDPIDGAELASRLESEVVRRGLRVLGMTGALSTERAHQALHASDATAKPENNELAADFVLTGFVLSEDSEEGGQTHRAFLTTLELTRTRSNEKVWMAVQRLRKRVVPPRQ